LTDQDTVRKRAPARSVGATFRVLIAIAASVLLAYAGFGLPVLDGVGLDLEVAARFWLLGARHVTGDSPVAIVTIDEESYRRPPLADRPVVLWTPEIARVLAALTRAGTKVVGFDLILPTSVQTFAPGYERTFLQALHAQSAGGGLVLGEAQTGDSPLLPFASQIMAAGGVDNLAPLNLVEDPDGVVRRVPLFMASSAGPVAGLALALAMRLQGSVAEPLDDGGVRLGGHTVPPIPGGGLLVNFDGGAGGIPHYSFADLLACVDQGRSGQFFQAFAGKAVLLGAVLDVEDRKLTSKRFAGAPDHAAEAERCALAPTPASGGSGHIRHLLPGVDIHAAALRDLVTGEWLTVPSISWRFFILFATSLAALWAGLASKIRHGLLVMVGMIAGGALIGVLALAWAVALPMLPALTLGVLAYGGAAVWRSALSDRRRRALARAFRLYLPGPMVDRMLAADRMPELGGELRQVSIIFSDIADFTSISEACEPQRLVADLNAYFDRMAEVIEAEGGFIDKFIGDAIVAVFGAPAGPVDHAAAAVRAAAGMVASSASGPFRIRIGVNSGTVLMGNIGASRRFNFTVIGDAVNLAARLEGANKLYGTAILVSGETMTLAGGTVEGVSLRAIDEVRVVGKNTSVRLFTLSGPDDRAFAQALAHYRSGLFGQASAAFAALADDPVAATLAQRSNSLVAAPPAGWDGVTQLTAK
jgi:adenylate cyclase